MKNLKTKGLALSQSKGFTLIELLIVIGILAILVTITIVILNPAQMFAQARDSQRMTDLETINKAISYYLAGATTPDMDDAYGGFCGTNFTSTFGAGATTSLRCGGTCTYQSLTAGATTTVSGDGWVPIDFTQMFTGATISDLPIDPTNTGGSTGLAYSYGCNNTTKTYELNANLESERYSTGGSDDRESRDGGNQTTLYETGNDPALDL